MGLSANDTLSQAFAFLQATVREYHVQGRRCIGANLKVELSRRAGNPFFLQGLGFSKFGDFIRAAERAGYVAVTQSPGGDLEISLPSFSRPASLLPQPPSGVGEMRTPYAASQEKASFSSERIAAPGTVPLRQSAVRQDLWNAFTKFGSGLLRVYDPASDKAYVLSEVPFPGEAEELTSMRERVLAKDPGVMEILPISRDQLLEWMRSFAEKLSPDHRSNLTAALSRSERPHTAFSLAIRQVPSLFKEWHQFHVLKVSEWISKWATQRNLKIQVLVPWVPRPQLSRSIVKLGSEPEVQARGIVSSRLLNIVDDLLDELIRLRGALSYLEK